MSTFVLMPMSLLLLLLTVMLLLVLLLLLTRDLFEHMISSNINKYMNICVKFSFAKHPIFDTVIMDHEQNKLLTLCYLGQPVRAYLIIPQYQM